MNSDAKVVARVSRRFEASPERVFDAWLDPATAGRWLFATPDAQMLRVEIDARVGGRFRIVERRKAGDAEHVGEYLEIDRPHRLVFSFGVEMYAQAQDRVSVDIVADGTGCVLTLTHEMAAEYAEYRERTESGWTGILEALARRLDT